MTFAPPRPSTFFGKPGAASGIVSPIDWRLGAQAGQNIGGALKNLGDIGGKVLTTKAQSKNMGDKARKALKIFGDDLELDDSDIDAMSRSEAEGALEAVPMMYKRWAEEDTQEYRDKSLALQEERAGVSADYYGALSQQLADKKDRFDRFNHSLQVSAANAEDVDKDRNYFLSQPGNTAKKWEKKATDAEKKAVKYFNAPAVQQVMQGAMFTPGEWQDVAGDAAPLSITRDPETGATVFQSGKMIQVVRKDVPPTEASDVQTMNKAAELHDQGNYLEAVNRLTGGARYMQLDHNTGLAEIIDRNVWKQHEVAQSKTLGLGSLSVKHRDQYKKAVSALNKGVGGNEEMRAVAFLQQVGDAMYRTAFELAGSNYTGNAFKVGNQSYRLDNQFNPVIADSDKAKERAQWFANMSIPDPASEIRRTVRGSNIPSPQNP